jgi:hypothetical protein
MGGAMIFRIRAFTIAAAPFAAFVWPLGCTTTPGGDVQFGGGSEADNGTPTTGANGCVTACDESSSGCDPGSGGCEQPCTPGEERPCYSGAEKTAGVGACRPGVNRCTAMGTWDLWCHGEVLPASEVCANGIDDDCDGIVDDGDNDGDGFGVCSGDCCDLAGCTRPELVNPGAYEVAGNGVDDNCDGDIDEAVPDCDVGLASNSTDAFAFARALDLCRQTVETPADPKDRTWGVISAKLSMADGQGTPQPVQHAIRSDFGDLIQAEHGAAMVVLSTGHAADTADTAPDFAPFQSGIHLDTSSPAPADWLAAHGGTFPNPSGCLEPWSTSANDPVMLTVRVRVPTNARSFSVRMQFFSAEYPEWVCSEFNDFFVTLVDSTAATNPHDKNIAVYDDGATVWPVGVNLVMVADGIFAQCENGEVGCAREVGSDYFGCVGDALLEGTGFDATAEACGGTQSAAGGGTGWLTMRGNVTPGEVMEIRFGIWDTSGHIYDSLVLLDDWSWSLDAAQPGVSPG